MNGCVVPRPLRELERSRSCMPYRMPHAKGHMIRFAANRSHGIWPSHETARSLIRLMESPAGSNWKTIDGAQLSAHTRRNDIRDWGKMSQPGAKFRSRIAVWHPGVLG